MKSHFNFVILTVLLLLPFLICDEVPKKLRRFKVCNGTKCRAIRSNGSPSFLQEMDSFLYSRWTRWATCTRQCTTKRYRSCKFPLICGNTVIHEEAFCYHRGTYCEFIFEKNKRDFLSNDDVDYLDQSDYEFQSNANNDNLIRRSEEEFSKQFLPFVSSATGSQNAIQRRKPTSSSVTSQQRQPRNENYLSQRRFQKTNTTPVASVSSYPYPPAPSRFNYDNFDLQSERPFSAQNNDNDHPIPQNNELETCGVSRITDRNRNGIALRILGGQEARQGRWPWQVAVLNKMHEAFCGGTLIAPRWILTAAHCIRKKLQVTIGEHHLHRNEGTEKNYKIDAAFIHPDFDHETVDNDIALLLLPEAVPTEAGLACLPSEREFLPPAGTLCTILGWGKERHTHVFGTTVLHEGKVPLVSAGECRYTYGQNEITDNMFCAGYRGGTVDSCAGDSGGPILCSINSRWTVFGVTSFGDGCGRKGKFGIYVKVPNYVNWINKVMKANDYLN